MHHSWACAVDDGFTALESLNARVLLNRSIKKLNGQLRGFNRKERFYDGYIHQSISHGSGWSYIGIIAILRGISTGDEESLMNFVNFLSVSCIDNINIIGVWVIAQTAIKHILYIREWTSP